MSAANNGTVDFHFADRAGVDMILVGDSAAMTMLGLPSTLQIGLDEMLVFIRAVTRAAHHASKAAPALR